MRWFKHLTIASQNPLIAEIEDKFGLEGYARYFKLIEAIAANMKNGGEPKLALPWSKWQMILKGKRNKLCSFLEHLANQSEIKLTQTGNILEIVFPNIKKYMDEWQSRLGSNSGAAREQELEVEVESETDVLSLEKKEPKKDSHSPDDPHLEFDAHALLAYLHKTKMPNAELGTLVDAAFRGDLSVQLPPGITRRGYWTEATIESWHEPTRV
jgi:hypothetical protein